MLAQWRARTVPPHMLFTSTRGASGWVATIPPQMPELPAAMTSPLIAGPSGRLLPFRRCCGPRRPSLLPTPVHRRLQLVQPPACLHPLYQLVHRLQRRLRAHVKDPHRQVTLQFIVQTIQELPDQASHVLTPHVLTQFHQVAVIRQ
ncbi:unnamed protein product [Closterium sp. NIES-53]